LFAAALIAVPWTAIPGNPAVDRASMAAVAAIAWGALPRARLLLRIGAAAVAIVALVLANRGLHRLATPYAVPPPSAISARTAADALASENWSDYMAAVARPVDADVLSRKGLVWAGFLLLGICALRGLRRDDDRRGVAECAGQSRAARREESPGFTGQGAG
jgi:hypothetical protein